MLSIPSPEVNAQVRHSTNDAHSNGHIEYSMNGHANGNHAAPQADPLFDIEIQLLALMKYRRGIARRICKQAKPLLRTDFNDPVSGCIYGAFSCATNEYGAATANDALKMLQSWTRENNDLAPLAIEAVAFWDAIEEPASAPDDAVAVALDLAHQVKERGTVQLESSTQANEETKPNDRFELFNFKALSKIPRQEWLVRGLLSEKVASVISADSGGFKSFFALDLGLCVALGRPFMGRDTKRGGVVYVAAEGFYTLHDRATAWALHHGCELPENFHALKVPINLGDMATVAAFASAVENLSPDLVILDTLSQCAVGANENDNGQMADFVRGMMALCGRIGAHVTVLHHNGKASGTFRGAGSIKANVDAHISLERPENDETNTVFIRCEKQRGRPFEPFALRGVEVVLPFVDEYGDAVTSLVFEPCGDEVAAKSTKKAASEKADKTSAALLAVFDEVAREAAALGIDGVKVGFWKEKACPEGEAAEPICSAPTFWRYRKSLENSGAIVECGSHNGSPLWKRKDATISTISTIKMQNDSNDSEPKTPGGKVLSQLSHPFRGDSDDSTDSDRPGMTVALPEMPPPNVRKKKNSQAASESYQASQQTNESDVPDALEMI